MDIGSQLATLNPNFDERGLIGLAFHPRYKDNGRFFIYYNRPPRDGGTLAFGPDGYLYIALGDGGAANDVAPGHVQDWYAANAGGNGLWPFSEIALKSHPDDIGYYLKGFGQDNQGEIYITTSELVGPQGTSGKVFKLVVASSRD